MDLCSKPVNVEKTQHGISFFTWTLLGQQPINQVQLSADFQIYTEKNMVSLFCWDQLQTGELTRDLSIQAGPI